MKCPFCEGEFESIELKTVAGRSVQAKHCTQCGGFWFSRPINEPLDPESVKLHDSPQPNYSLRTFDIICPVDKTLLHQAEHDALPNGAKHWTCPDCGGSFFPRGQLALVAQWRHQNSGEIIEMHLAMRKRVAVAVTLVAVLGVAIVASWNNFSLQFSAAEGSPLPTSGPNVITLLLLALAYLAGTILAVLGRKLPTIVLGWGVIVICTFGFAVVIFGP